MTAAEIQKRYREKCKREGRKTSGQKTSAERSRRYKQNNPKKVKEQTKKRTSDGRAIKATRKYRRTTRYGWFMALIGRIKANNKYRKIPREFNLVVNEILKLWDRQGGRCAVTKIPLEIGVDAWCLRQPSIDRIDHDKGYTIDNIRLTCLWVNVARGKWADNQLLEMCKILVEAHGIN